VTTGVRNGWIEDLSNKLYCHIMKMEQMTTCLLAEIRANNNKFEVFCGNLVSQLDIHQARTEPIQVKIIAETYTHRVRTEASMNAL
jgi:hypothetical protein